MQDGLLAVGDSNGNLSWFDRSGVFLRKLEGSSGIVMMAADCSRSLLAVGREREHTFEFYTHQDAFSLELA